MQHHFLLPFVLLRLFLPTSSIHLGHGAYPDNALRSRVVSARPLHSTQFSTSQRQSPEEHSGGLENPIKIFGGSDRRSQVVHPSDVWFVRDPEFFHDREYLPDSFSRGEQYELPKSMNADLNGKDEYKGEEEIEVDGFPQGWFDDPEFFNDPLPLASHAPNEDGKGWDADSSEWWTDDPEFYGDQVLPQELWGARGKVTAEGGYVRRLLRPKKATVEGGVHRGDLRQFSLSEWGKKLATYMKGGSERGFE